MKGTWTDSYAKFADIDSDEDDDKSVVSTPSVPPSFVAPTRFDTGSATLPGPAPGMPASSSLGLAFAPTESLDYENVPAFAENAGRLRALPQQPHEVGQMALSLVYHMCSHQPIKGP